jgi:hypothetical protein
MGPHKSGRWIHVDVFERRESLRSAELIRDSNGVTDQQPVEAAENEVGHGICHAESPSAERVLVWSKLVEGPVELAANPPPNEGNLLR